MLLQVRIVQNEDIGNTSNLPVYLVNVSLLLSAKFPITHYFNPIKWELNLFPFLWNTSVLAAPLSRAKHKVRSLLNSLSNIVFEIPGSPASSDWIIWMDCHNGAPLCLVWFGECRSVVIHRVHLDSGSDSNIEFQDRWLLICYHLPFSIGRWQIASLISISISSFEKLGW